MLHSYYNYCVIACILKNPNFFVLPENDGKASCLLLVLFPDHLKETVSDNNYCISFVNLCVHFFKTAEFTFQRLLLFFSSEWMVRPYVPLISDRKAIKYNSLVVGVLVFVLLSKSKAAKISSIQIELLELTWMKYFLGGENFEVILRCAMNRFKTLFFNW